ncbi:MAG: ATP-binding cassette domain-containing protein [Alphaproteobacteria bacterium]|nr:ATP-binding cassette domain-containing protein [Alphaproteobacteria bacterium]
MSDAYAPAALNLQHVSRTYHQGQNLLVVFHHVNVAIQPGEVVALVGPSGAGKSSMLHMAGLLESPSEGEIFISGQAASRASDAERTRIRRDSIGFVYQAHHLLPEFSALENVMLPQMIAGVPKKAARAEARRLLELVGLGQRIEHRPSQLSGGEQQRVAIVRAIANHPRLLLADEPTGNLDPRTAGGVFDLLIALARAEKVAALVATHNFDLAAKMDRTLVMQDGHIVDGGKFTAHKI